MNAFMKYFVALIAGAMSGFLIYMVSALLFLSDTGNPPSWFIPVTFLGGLALSTFVLVRGARAASKVVSRSFLLGAAEWFAVIPAGFIFASKTAAEATSELSSDAEVAGTVIGAGLVTFLTGGVAFVMMFGCLLGYFITFLMTREMKTEKTI